MMEEGKRVSVAALCRFFGVPRSSFYYRPKARQLRPCDPQRVGSVREIIDENPLYGLRRIVAVGPSWLLHESASIYAAFR
jgi:putative transposase